MANDIQYLFTNGGLHIVGFRERITIRAWPRPVARTSEDGTEWKYYYPEFRFISHPRPLPPVPPVPPPPPPPPPPAKKGRRGRPDPQLELKLVYPEAGPLTSESQRAEAFELLRQTLPEEIAGALAPFQSCQWNPLVFVHFDRGFLDLLKSSPALAYYLANDRDVSLRIYRERQTFLPKLIGSKQVDLLDHVGLGCRKQMVGILKKIRADAVGMENIRELQNSRGNPEALKRLSHLKSINQGVLALVGEGDRLMKYWTPSFLDDVSRDEASHCSPSAYLFFSHCFRMHWKLHPNREFPPMTGLAKLRAYFEELVEEQLRREAAARPAPGVPRQDQRKYLKPFPPPPLPDSEGIQAILSDTGLRIEGHEQHNCVGGYGGMVRQGNAYVYRVMKPERATLCIMKGTARWYPQELKATCNRQATPATLHAVQKWLDACQQGISY